MNAQISSEFIILEFISAPSVPFQMTLYAEKLFIDWGDGKCLSYDPQISILTCNMLIERKKYTESRYSAAKSAFSL